MATLQARPVMTLRTRAAEPSERAPAFGCLRKKMAHLNAQQCLTAAGVCEQAFVSELLRSLDR